MTLKLPYDCLHLILSYIPLPQFNTLNPPDAAWTQRYFNRYFDHVTNKKNYLIRAASEHYEICADTEKYFNPSILYYYIAKGGHWELLETLITTRSSPFLANNFRRCTYLRQIFLMACEANTIAIVKEILKDEIPVSTCDDFISTPEICQLVYQFYQSNKQHEDYLSQMLRSLPFDQFKSVVDNHSSGIHEYIYYMGMYQQHRPNHWEEVLEKVAYYEGSNPNKLYHNLPLGVDIRPNDIMIIANLHSQSITRDWLLHLTLPAHICTTAFNFYKRLPNASARAEAILPLLYEMAPQNHSLYGYIILFKIWLNRATADDFKNYIDSDRDLINMLVYSGGFDLLLIRPPKTQQKYTLCNCVFTRKNFHHIIHVQNIEFGNCDFQLVLTLPLIDQLTHDPQVNPDLLREVQTQAVQWLSPEPIVQYNNVGQTV